MHCLRCRRTASSHSSSRGVAAAGLACALLLSGCASGGIVARSLEFVGLKTPDSLSSAKDSANAANDSAAAAKEELAKLPVKRDVTLRIHAGRLLNADATGRPLSLVTRIYKLRSTAQFTQASYAMFAAADATKQPFAEDVISMNEIVLAPGQKYEVVESLPLDVSHLAVVALFRAPDEQRWRFVFETKAASASGLTLGAHGCALSVSEGAPLGAPPDALRLAGVRCR
jgi:type VI secretion system protein VasD